MDTYITKIQYMINKISSVYSYPCFNSTYPSDTSTDGKHSEVRYNPAYSHIKQWEKEFNNIKNEIFNALDFLFNNTDSEYGGPDENFNIINGFAENSQTYKIYDKNKDEFIENANFFYVRGHMYDMLDKANQGQYLIKYYSNINNFINLCNTYQNMYEKYPEPPTPDPESAESSISKLEYFWDSEYNTFKLKVDSCFDEMLIVKKRFIELHNFIRKFKALFFDISDTISSASIFLDAGNKTCTESGTSLIQTFDRISKDMNMYSSHLGDDYTMYKNASDKNEEHYDPYEDKTMKFLISDTLIMYDYYKKSQESLEWIINFRKEFNI